MTHEEKLNSLNKVLKDKQWDKAYWLKRIEETKGTISSFDHQANLEDTLLEIEALEHYAKSIKKCIYGNIERSEESKKQFIAELWGTAQTYD